MDINIVSLAGFADTTSNSDLFTFAVNNVIPISTTQAALYVTQEAPETTAALGNQVGGSSSPTLQVQPSYFPMETKGAECAAIVSDLSWADSNLEAGYEFLQLKPAVTTGTKSPAVYFVSGVLNSDKEQFNQPFQDSKLDAACCWDGDYKYGMNPFA